MMKSKKILILPSVLLLAFCMTACNQNPPASEENQEITEEITETIVTETTAPIETPDETSENFAPLTIAQQGMFSAGGIITSAVSGEYDPEQSWKDSTRAGNTSHVDHANVFYQIPENASGNPIVYLHGYRQSRMCWLTTPDGREGWSVLFMRNGHGAFLVDQPRRGEAGLTTSIPEDTDFDMWYGDLNKGKTKETDEDGNEIEEDYEEETTPEGEATQYQPGDQAWYTYYRIGEEPGKKNKNSQFPDEEEALNQFFRQATPNTGEYDNVVVSKALGEVVTKANEMTGKKPIFMAHAQGASIAWDLSAENLSAIVAIEPIEVPSSGSVQYQKLLEAQIPIVIYFGDYITNGDEELASTVYWQEIRENAVAFAEQYTEDGGDCTVVDLPEEGIKGNSHFLFQEKNNKEIADSIEKWLNEHGLSQS